MFQSIQLIGNLGKKPEMRYTPSGQAVTNFSVATTNAYTDKNGEKVKETTWWRVSVWGKLAENCNKYLDKGSLVKVEGRISVDKTTGAPKIFTKQDGSAGCNLEMVANSVLFLSKSNHDGMTETAQELGGQSIPEDDIPF